MSKNPEKQRVTRQFLTQKLWQSQVGENGTGVSFFNDIEVKP